MTADRMKYPFHEYDDIISHDRCRGARASGQQTVSEI